ncbi:AhpC/TSA antioxidant enzyme-domain-containing protein [Tuber brumale]|nr:AhpC/TSA antioxidant enzyme-domain-containing protein [Tuber brumale]
MSSPQSDPHPSDAELAEAAAFQVFDKDGTSYPFSSLYEGEGTTAIVFIRHFFCGNCQEYLRVLSNPPIIPPNTPGKKLIIVGHGDPAVIETYTAETGCVFPIYTEPTRKLYTLFGMVKNLKLGEKPEYIQQSAISGIATSFVSALKWGGRKGGDYQQNGGEWMWENGKLVWCHRMKNTRDHLEVEDLKKVLRL